MTTNNIQGDWYAGGAVSELRWPLRGGAGLLQKCGRRHDQDAHAFQGVTRPIHDHAGQREQGHACGRAAGRFTRLDVGRPLHPKANFNGIALAISTKTEAEADKVFNGLANGGQVQMPLTKTFFSSKFGMLADKFGVGWMVLVAN
ncbi:MAG: VOC family protein [Xanthobacteraceae bacterium]